MLTYKKIKGSEKKIIKQNDPKKINFYYLLTN